MGVGLDGVASQQEVDAAPSRWLHRQRGPIRGRSGGGVLPGWEEGGLLLRFRARLRAAPVAVAGLALPHRQVAARGQARQPAARRAEHRPLVQQGHGAAAAQLGLHRAAELPHRGDAWHRQLPLALKERAVLGRQPGLQVARRRHLCGWLF